MDRRGDLAAECHKARGLAHTAHLRDGAFTEQPAKGHELAGFLTRHGDDAHRSGLAVDHSDGHFIRDDGRDGGRVHRTGDGDHIQPHRADTGHGFKFFDA